MKRIALLALMTISVAPPALADVMLRGPGVQSCTKYGEARKLKLTQLVQLEYYAWVTGYVDAYNLLLRDTQVSVPEEDETLAYLDKYCQAHPLSKVVEGTHCLIHELGGMKQASPMKCE